MDRVSIHSLIFKAKRMFRRCDVMLAHRSDSLRCIKAEIAALETNPFNRHRVEVLRQEQAVEAQNEREWHDLRKNAGLHLSALMKLYDGMNPRAHDIAQILGISDIAYSNFVDQFPDVTGSLHSAAFMGAETHFEKDTFVGHRAPRDNPMYWATWYEFVELFDTDEEFKTVVEQAFDDVFGAIPRYRQSIADNGTEYLERIPPDLKLVKA